MKHLRFVPDKTSIGFMKIRKLNFFLSFIFIILSCISFYTKGMNFGIDFSGGMILELESEKGFDLEKIYSDLHNIGLHDVHAQNFNGNNLMIKISQKYIKNSEAAQKIKGEILNSFEGNIKFKRLDFVGPQIGKELIKNGFLAVAFSFLAIMVYVAIRFEWQYGIGLLLALFHDVIVTLGIASFMQFEFDLTAVAAILTIIGYSVNDSVVIYDRIRENFKKHAKKSTSQLIDLSINETLSRTTLTVATTVLAALALVLFGGSSLFSFSIITLIGIIIGTYSSIYVSAPVLIHLGLDRKKQ